MIKVAFLTTDNREQQKRYELKNPFFGTAPTALLDGFACVPVEIEVHVISCSKRTMTEPEKLAPNIFFHQPIVPHVGWGRTAFAGCALAVRKLIKRIRPDIVHGQGTERDCAISAVYSGYPNVLTIHGNMQQIYRLRLLGAESYYWLASTLETHALGRAAGVFCNSRHTCALVEGRARKTWLVPNPIRPAFLETHTQEKPSNPHPVFLVIGVVTRLKRPLEILQVMKALYDAGHRFKILFIGSHSPDNPYGAQFQLLLDEAVRNGYAEYLGVLDQNDLIREMDQADALIHFPEEESFGLVVAEALARNLKVFVARIGGIPDILEGTDASEMFDDFASLKNGIRQWINQGCIHPTGNPDHMRDRYSPVVVARKHLEIYREVVARSSNVWE